MKRFTFTLSGSSDCAPHSAAADFDDGDTSGETLSIVDETLDRSLGVPRAAGQGFIGRAPALSELDGALGRALASRGSLVLVAGEPGIGKTRLMAEFAALAQHAGVTSLWANCWEGGEAPAFWPWIQILRAYVRSRGTAPLPSGTSAAALELSQLVPELGAANPSSATFASGSTPQEARFRLFDAFSSFLRAASRERPLLIDIDNLHAADEASLALLRFLASDLWDARVLVVASYRDGEAGSDTPLWRLLGELGAAAQRIQLAGLGPAEVAQLIAELETDTSDRELARTLHARTQGNPFYVREVLRLLRAGGDALEGVPDSVAQVIERRLSRLALPALALLRSASVLGTEFAPELLAAVSGQPLDATLPLLVSHRLLARDRAADNYRFAHALLREVCYGQLSDARRRELHRNAATVIAAREPKALHASEVAFHALQAGEPADLQLARASLELAAREARRLGAHEDAVHHLTRALELAARNLDSSDALQRTHLLLELGAAQMAAGALPAAQKTHAEAAKLAEQLQQPELLARAALGYGVEFGAGGSDDQEVELLEAALAALPPADSSLRARVLSRLSRALLFGVRHTERVTHAEAALEMARRLGDPATLASVLFAHHQSLWTGAPAETRCAIADEIVQLAEATGDRALAQQARALRLGDLLELGTLERYRAECASYARCVQDDKLVSSAWHVPMQQATLAMLAGQFADAERLGAEGLALGKRISHQGIEVFHHSVLMTIRYLQGRHAELLPQLRHGATAYPTLPVFRAGLALAHAERGERLEASLAFEQLAVGDFAGVPRDFLWVFNLALLSITAHFLGDAARAKRLYDWLEPYANYNVRVTRIGISSIGSTQHYLGLLAVTFGELDRAAQHLARAVEAHAAQGALAMLANSQLQWARALDVRAATGDAAQAAEMRGRALQLAASLGIRLVLAELDPATPPRADGSDSDRAPSGRAVTEDHVRLRRDGPDWVLEHRGRSLRWRNAVGMEMLARLLREPEREFSALELRGDMVAGIAHSDSGELLDERATHSYRERASALREAIEHAEQIRDLGGASRARDELEHLEAELRRAIGLGGRARRAGATHERARISATKAIRAALRKIAEQDSELGAHLERSVRTGQLCAYRPDPSAALRWSVEE